MMDFVKQWIFSICVTLIISAIFSMLAPKGSIGRFYKIVISVFIFVSFVFPLMDFDFDELKPDINFEPEYYHIMESSAENQIKSLISETLIQNGIENAEIIALVTEKNEELEIENITICINGEYDTEEVKSLVLDNLGLVCEVTSYE